MSESAYSDKPVIACAGLMFVALVVFVVLAIANAPTASGIPPHCTYCYEPHVSACCPLVNRKQPSKCDQCGKQRGDH